MDYAAKIKASLLLPRTDFPMRAELPKREPALLAKWREEKVYDRIMAARKDAPQKFVLHDGPPFANGDAHMGHALNMVLKDIVLKYHNMSGHYAPFVPGWDCHGLPIEHKVMKELGAEETDPVKIREKCEATARHFISIQSEQFQRLGVFGDWENPYLTLNPAYEAETLRVFAMLVEKNLVYQGLRPVLWSTGCQTALAEAEIEYKEKVDPAIYVKFPLQFQSLPHEKWLKKGLNEANFKILKEILKGTSLLIWTTTPWTLPANLAVAVAPNLEYAVYDMAGAHLLMTAGLAASVGSRRTPCDGSAPGTASAAIEPKRIAGPWKGSDLIGLTYTHPFLNDGRTRQIFAADFVTADAGTGLVHIAPGHGHDDYQLGQQHGLPVLAPVDDRGCLTAEFLPANADEGVKALVGQYVFKANPKVIEILEKRGLLFAQEEYRHDYPHCWRSKTPIVFRAVKQWFIKMEDADPKKNIRAQALAAIDDKENLKFFPENGRNRIRGAVESRPDWCISRQRTWGIPLPVFYGEGGQPLLSEKTIRKFAGLVEKEGAGIWFSRSADELAAALELPRGLKKGRDTLDVWIDSGTSWAAVVGQRDELKPAPADLYLEGSDQHRGWFQSSLLTSVAATGKAPYRAVLTNGFVVDIEGKKLSKSGTGYQKPVDLMSLVNEHGADVLRLWVASQDYQDDIPFSNDIFARVADTYRSIRNTLRILLGNLADFDPAKDGVTDRLQVDLYYEVRFLLLSVHVKEAYASYNFSQVYHLINRFCAVDLSAQYVDFLKDRLYCGEKTGRERRSAQTTLHRILLGLTKMLAPLIPFTAEETWQFAGQSGSIHTNDLFPARAAARHREDYEKVETKWASLLDLRSRVNEKLETARRDKKIGKSLEAHVEITSRHPELVEGSVQSAILEELFIVSKVIVKPTDGEETITVTRAEDHGMKKCIRCWKYWNHVGTHADHPELCDRCTNVMVNLGNRRIG
ncbi:MAG: isoleucine--tRNA ligase [Methylacidiphilales bacterium]|nr:isoleucine--tRNA ligase [Candidatus Methylacidiphilales bacterium]